MAPAVAPLRPMYPPGAPGLGQQFLYGQGPPTIIPQQVSCFFICHSNLAKLVNLMKNYLPGRRFNNH